MTGALDAAAEAIHHQIIDLQTSAHRICAAAQHGANAGGQFAAILEKIKSVNQTLFHLLEETRRSLAGQADFTVETIRQLSLVVADMDVVLPRSTQLRAAHPELVAPLDHYLRMVTDLRSELQKVHGRLLARRTELEGARSQLHAASQFVSALSSTR